MPDKKLTDAEIIKALECCKCGTLNDCDGCPCFSDEDINTARECAENLMSNALDLINRLQADVDNYKQIAENQQKITMDRGFEIKRLKEKIESLQAENERLKNCWKADVVRGIIAGAKAEAYKEFAEKLHEELRIYGIKDKFNKSVFLNVVDKAKKRIGG